MKKHLLFFAALLITFISFSQDPDTDCPAPETFFVGEYQISDVDATIGPGNGTSNFAPGIVTITANGNTRTFQNAVLPAFNGEIETINLILNCGVIQIEDVDPALACDGVNPYIFTTPDETNSTPYSLTESDGSFIINYIEDPLGSCAGPYNASFSLTKLCSDPEDISFTNPTATSVNLNWVDNNTPNTSNTYYVEYGSQGFIPGTGQSFSGLTETQVTVSGLTTNMPYDFYIRNSCSDGSNSGLAGPFNYTIIDSPNPDFILAPNGVTCLCPDANFGDIGTILINGELKTFTKRTRNQLDAIIAANLQDPEIALTCTSGITTMEDMFSLFVIDPSSFNQNLHHWDVSNVTTMRSMFAGATIFNQPLNDWDTSNVTNMEQMLAVATAFNQPLDNWDVSNVTTMRNLFLGATTFNQNVNNWNVSNVTDMSSTFSGFGGTAAFNMPLDNWDVSNVETMSFMFSNGSFNQSLTNWNVGNVTDMSRMFLDSPFNQQINNWDVSNVQFMGGMFSETSVFNQSLGNWDVSNVIFMDDMFSFAAAFNQSLANWNFNSEVNLESFLDNSVYDTANYDELLQSFNSQNLTGLNLGAVDLSYCDEISRSELIETKGWTITGDFLGQCGATLNPSTTPFVTTWTLSTSLTVDIYTDDAFDYNYTIDWGDGQTNTNITGNITHLYSNPGTYTVSIIGIFPYFRTCDPSIVGPPCYNASQLTSVESWGDQEWQVMISSFSSAANFDISTTQAPDLTSITSLKDTFRNASNLNQNINNWDVSQVTDMAGTFSGANEFNQPLNNWDVSNVTNMAAMLESTFDFNQSIGNWDVSNVVKMENMFRSASSFNQPINNWNVSNVTDMAGMFDSASSFNQPLDNWDVSQVTEMQSMFVGDFNDGSSFNQPINNWDIGSVTNMQAMFRRNASFNQPLNDWNTSNVTIMSNMFDLSTAFNQPLNDWDTSNVTSMSFMFNLSTSFNQPLDNWDVSNVTDMFAMFTNATLFNQDISNWCVEQITEQPGNFAENTALQMDFFPNWGAECETFSIVDENYTSIKVYPNPVIDLLKLDIGNQSKARVSIYDTSGKLIMEQDFEGNIYSLDVRELQSGLYLLTLNSEEKTTTLRFVKE